MRSAITTVPLVSSLGLALGLMTLGCQKHPGAEQPAPGQKQPTPQPNPRVEGDDVQIKVTPVAGSVYMLEGQGGNIGVSVGEDGVLMIDDQFLPLAPKIREAIAGIAKGKNEIEFLINTHHHGDHTGGNPDFGKEAHIVAHTNVRKRVTTDQQALGRTTKALPPEGWPVITYDDSLSIHFNGEEIKVIHLSGGHTDGDSIVYFTKSNVLHTGDQMVNGRFPFIDVGAGGNVERYVANLGKILEIVPPDVKIIPGHGPLSTVQDLQTLRQLLVEATDLVRKAIAAGKTLDQIKAAGLPAKYKTWSSGFINTESWLAIVHASLTSK